MKKTIFKNFLRETTIFFLLSCSSVALIVWVIQAVNYLGFVTEDGHGFKIYFLYTLLSLPKIFNEIFNIQKKRIYNALLNSSSEEVINFDNVISKIING